jgi:hypothetical protein
VVHSSNWGYGPGGALGIEPIIVLILAISTKTGKSRNLRTFPSRAAAEKRERAVQYFKRLGR